jgi:hypothetical protein
MALINVAVHPWKIIHVGLGKESIREFYQETFPTIAGSLSEVYLGPSKDSLDLIEFDIELLQAVSTFGRYLKFVVEKETEPIAPPLLCGHRSVADVLMNAQRALDQPRLPTKIIKQTITSKDRLFNAVIDFLHEQELAWPGATEADGIGRKFVSCLVDCLWYIDGHIEVFEKQGCKIPDFVSLFDGYNKPEASKHRKRSRENMSASVIRTHSSTLFTCLQSTYWSRSKFAVFKPCIEQLGNSIVTEVTYFIIYKSNMV